MLALREQSSPKAHALPLEYAWVEAVLHRAEVQRTLLFRAHLTDEEGKKEQKSVWILLAKLRAGNMKRRHARLCAAFYSGREWRPPAQGNITTCQYVCSVPPATMQT